MSAAWLEVALHSPAIPGAAAFAVRSALESALMALLVLGLIRLLPGLDAQTRSRLWLWGFAAAVILPFVHVPGNAAPLDQLPGLSAAAGQAGAAPLSTHVETHVQLWMARLQPRVLPSVSFHWALVVCGLWAAGSLFALSRLVLGAVALRRVLRHARPAPPALQALYDNLLQRTEWHGRRAGRARLLVTSELATPSACGLFGRAILLPEVVVLSLSPEELQWVLRHEAAHLARWDDVCASWALLARAALPLSFALALIAARAAEAREMACDDAALQGAASPKSYAACLARVAECAAQASWQPLSLGLAGEQSQLAARVQHILHRAPHTRRASAARMAALAFAALGLGTALVVAPTPLQFAPASQRMPGPVEQAALPAAHVRSAVFHPGPAAAAQTISVSVTNTAVTHPRRRASQPAAFARHTARAQTPAIAPDSAGATNPPGLLGEMAAEQVPAEPVFPGSAPAEPDVRPGSAQLLRDGVPPGAILVIWRFGKNDFEGAQWLLQPVPPGSFAQAWPSVLLLSI
ncbi:M56 family metallopeptidase [Acidipila sp. EB88]|uniref:M56 family metallopeptidase n=1 Tax=Acidipila sp. EB88 TaxID=2305226 RepID=UPI000F5FEB6A|nr:M56 family metallopeptidase [Acidipila sp. EB88]RRA47965.1 hypothetical protein D1Y84_06350 [Acidipila sp. EB88]